MTPAHVRLTYDGSALQAHTMDVRALAPALLAFGDLCEEAGKVLLGTEVTTRVEVRASFRTGSFGIDLTVAPQLLNQLISWLSGPGAAAAANGFTILSALGVTGGGLIAALRWLRNRRIKRIELIPEGRRILVEDGDSLVVEEHVLLLLRSRTVRTHLQRVVEPIEREGVDVLAFGSDDEIQVEIREEEAPFFHVPLPEDTMLADQVRVMSFSIVSLSFKEENKWRLSDGQNTIYVHVADQAFLDSVNRNLVRFAKGDILLAETRIAQWEGSDGLRTEYTIMKVLEHRPGLAQIPLPIDGE